MHPKSYIYYNLHRKIWSIMERGRVIDHLKRVIVQGVEFRVRPAGRAKVIREKRKNVHAFVVGDYLGGYCGTIKMEQIKYNPYKMGVFYKVKTGEPVCRASIVDLRGDGTAWAHGAY